MVKIHNNTGIEENRHTPYLQMEIEPSFNVNNNDKRLQLEEDIKTKAMGIKRRNIYSTEVETAEGDKDIYVIIAIHPEVSWESNNNKVMGIKRMLEEKGYVKNNEFDVRVTIKCGDPEQKARQLSGKGYIFGE